MKITDVKSYVVSPGDTRAWLLVEVETDEGVTGVGECSNQTSIAHLARGIEVIRNYLIGRDPAQIEAHWQRIYHSYGELNPRGYITHLLSAIDIALWDIKGKVLGVPIYELLGGPVRDRVPLYTHVPGPGSGISLDRLKDFAREAMATGYEALKTDPFPSQLDPDSPYDGPLMVERLDPRAIRVAVECMEALREATGPDFELLVDAHARFDTQSAILGALALEPIELIWYEEPTHLESNQALKQIRENTRIPLCVGEHHFTRWDFVHVLEERLVDYIMPDVAWCGGISEWRRIASMAEPNYIRVSPHDAIGPVAMVASFHVSMATPNHYRQEIVRTSLDTFSQFITPMPEIRSGAMLPSDRPGLGIDLNHEMIRRHLVDRDDPVTMWPRWRGLYRGLPGESPIGGKPSHLDRLNPQSIVPTLQRHVSHEEGGDHHSNSEREDIQVNGVGLVKVRRAHHTGFTVSNLERSISFYRDLLGLEVIGEQLGSAEYLATVTGFPSVRLRMAFLRAPGSADHILELLEYENHPGEPTPRETNRPGNGHLCFIVDDAVAVYCELVAKGVRFMSDGPALITAGVNRGALAAYLRDPDDVTIEIFQPPG